MDTVLLDTDVFSYLLTGHRRGDPYKRHVYRKTIAISFVSIGKLYSGALKGGWGAVKLESLESRLRAALTVSLDRDVCRAYATIRNQKSPTGSHRVVEANDAWIAACAVRHALPLVSNNRRHFDWIPGLTPHLRSTTRDRVDAGTSAGLGDIIIVGRQASLAARQPDRATMLMVAERRSPSLWA